MELFVIQSLILIPKTYQPLKSAGYPKKAANLKLETAHPLQFFSHLAKISSSQLHLAKQGFTWLHLASLTLLLFLLDSDLLKNQKT